jgi:hypothetical protein
MRDKRNVMTLSVTNSRKTFEKMMNLMDESYEWELEIKPFNMAA